MFPYLSTTKKDISEKWFQISAARNNEIKERQPTYFNNQTNSRTNINEVFI